MNDEELLERLREAMFGLDLPPAEIRAAALRALTWDTDLERLLEKTYDSALVDAGMRSAVSVRDLTFELGQLVIELTIEPGQRSDKIVSGRVSPSPESLSILVPGREPQPVPCDPDGRFSYTLNQSTIAVEVLDSSGQRHRTELFSTD